MENVYYIKDNKFKSITVSINYTMNVEKSEISKNAVLASLLRKSCEKYRTQKEIENYLDSLYGAKFGVNVEKIGDLYNIEFKIECINDFSITGSEEILYKCLEFLRDVIYSPNLINGNFDEESLNREKQYIIEKIKETRDDKRQNAVARTFELMYPELPFGCLVYGNEEEVKKIGLKDVSSQYNKLINNSKITMILTGDLEKYDNLEENISELFENKLRKSIEINKLIIDKSNGNDNRSDVKEFVEEQDTYQSSLTFVLKNTSNEDDYLKAILYNSILGGNPSSKLFQNFRERESLAYTVVSQYYRYKKIFLIYAGIQRKDYDKAKEVVIEQISDILANQITEEEFLAAKKGLISDIEGWRDSKSALTRLMLTNVLLGKQPDITIDSIVRELEKYTKEDIVELANKLEVKQIYLLGGKQDV